MNPSVLHHPKTLWVLALGLAVHLSVQLENAPAQSSLADAEKVSAQTGRTLFVVAGQKT